MILQHIRKRLKLFSILSSLILLFPTQTSTQACGYTQDAEELRYMLFNPDLIQNKAWWSFFYNAKYLYLDGSTFSQEDEIRLCEEWKTKLKYTGNTTDILQFIFKSSSDSALQHNQFYKSLANHKQAQRYFELAKKGEAYSTFPSHWNADPQQDEKLIKNRYALIAELEKEIKKETDPFLQRKYAFQLVKLSYYANDAGIFNRYYALFPSPDSTTLDWWAMHYKSMMLEKEDKTDSANYYHALVFSRSANKMLASRQYFSSRNLERIFSLARTDAQKADIQVLTEVINPGRSLSGIKQVYQWQPNHKHLPLLITREINKLEDWLGGRLYIENYYPVSTLEEAHQSENIQHDYQYLNSVISAFKGMNVLAKQHPSFYSLSLAYLYLLKGDYKNAKTLLQTNESRRDLDYQKMILLVVLTTLEKDITDPSTQHDIGALLEQLIANREQQFESQKNLYSLFSYLRYVFAQKGMIPIAGLLDNYARNKFCYDCNFGTFEYSLIKYWDNHASATHLNNLLTLYHKASKNKLEELLCKPYSHPYYFYDLLAVKHLRHGNVEEAMNTLQKVPDEFWFSYKNAVENLDRDPFLENNHLLTQQTMAHYNKREILEKMIWLEKETQKDIASKSEIYFQLANAWYNFNDNSWFMLRYGWNASDSYNPSHGNIAFQRAIYYYEKALEESPAKELQAKIYYMLTVLANDKKRVHYAKNYEALSKTAFYQKRNCLTLNDLIRNTK